VRLELWYRGEVRRLILGLALLIACGDNVPGGSAIDAAVIEPDGHTMTGPCWPEVAEKIPHGTFTMGMGRGGFQTMPEDVPLEWGFQDGFMFVLSARMAGFPPGHPTDILDPSNPYTRIRAYFDDTNVPLAKQSVCPFRNGYKETTSGEYVLNQEVGIVFDTCWRIDRLVGQRIRIEGELLDPSGHYASETRVVTAVAPVDPNYPMETNTEPCPP
jgi:hypothetical protein